MCIISHKNTVICILNNVEYFFSSISWWYVGKGSILSYKDYFRSRTVSCLHTCGSRENEQTDCSFIIKQQLRNHVNSYRRHWKELEQGRTFFISLVCFFFKPNPSISVAISNSQHIFGYTQLFWSLLPAMVRVAIRKSHTVTEMQRFQVMERTT